MHVVDRRGRELPFPCRAHSAREGEDLTISSPPTRKVARGLYISALGEEGPVGLVAEPDGPDTYRCNDLELIDPEEEH